MKFIRVHGRVVPIKDKQGSGQSGAPLKAKDYDKAPITGAAKLGALTGFGLAMGGGVGLGVGAAAGIAGMWHGIRSPIKEGKKKGLIKGVGHFYGQSAAAALGSVAGVGVGAAGHAGARKLGQTIGRLIMKRVK